MRCVFDYILTANISFSHVVNGGGDAGWGLYIHMSMKTNSLLGRYDRDDIQNFVCLCKNA